MRWIDIAVTGALVALAGGAVAHGDEAHEAKKTGPVKKEQEAWGIAGAASNVARTVSIEMLDTMRFTPDRIDVVKGQTVRFVMTNRGKIPHELVIGTRKALEGHAALMVKFPGMEHDEPYTSHVAPGKTGEIVWTFNRAGDFDFACLVPGHYEAGMVGKIHVSAK